MKKVLFVCTGNTCRSPMAEAIFNNMTKNIDFTASSCGIYADGISRISENAKIALYDFGIDFDHISVTVNEELLKSADFIFGITATHARSLISMFPEYAGKIYSMPKDIPDPYGGNLDTYTSCRNEITECIKSLIPKLCGEENG